mmetsp:Transcript_5767/g.6627  ORF Transcript_5767/g.6627 Transcript_5767/m.6627 type:complete len:86 (+) Transcript_5767:112-369(+)
MSTPQEYNWKHTYTWRTHVAHTVTHTVAYISLVGGIYVSFSGWTCTGRGSQKIDGSTDSAPLKLHPLPIAASSSLQAPHRVTFKD